MTDCCCVAASHSLWQTLSFVQHKAFCAVQLTTVRAALNKRQGWPSSTVVRHHSCPCQVRHHSCCQTIVHVFGRALTASAPQPSCIMLTVSNVAHDNNAGCEVTLLCCGRTAHRWERCTLVLDMHTGQDWHRSRVCRADRPELPCRLCGLHYIGQGKVRGVIDQR